jgi:hypothetical protein
VKGEQTLLAFNRGRISRLAMGRVDLKRMALSAAIQTNWMPRVLGSMMLRPGLQYLHTQPSLTRAIPFVFSNDDKAKIDVHNLTTSFNTLDVRLNRGTVTAAITNGAFGSNITSWTAVTPAGTVAAWQTGGYAGLSGDGTAVASIEQQVTINESGSGHGLRIIVERGPIMVRVGATTGTDTWLGDTELGTGAHTLLISPTGASFFIKFFNQNQRLALLDSVALESAGVVDLPSPWTTADLPLLRYDQSGDIVFVACDGKRPYRIMRRDVDSNSWSIEQYLVNDGPFRLENTTTTTITPSALTGNITLTSSAVATSGIFKSTHVGALFSITSVGQTVADALTVLNDVTTHIRVVGVTDARTFGYVVAGTFVATVALQRSFDEGATWNDLLSVTAPVTSSLTDGLENQIVWYRFKCTAYTSGQADVTLTYAAGSITGFCRVTAYTSSTSVSAEVLTALGGTAASDVWAEGAWSDYRGWPTCVRFDDGRLWWFGNDHFWGSVTDQYYSHDAAFEGDAGPISRSVGFGTVDSIHWALSLQRLVVGTDGAEVSCQASALDEVLTPTNFRPRPFSSQGSAAVGAVAIDNSGVFVSRNGTRVYEIAPAQGGDYVPEDLTQLIPEMGDPGITLLAVQRKPDTRVHCLRSDGTVAVLVFDKAENVLCWVDVETDGVIVDICIMPGDTEDWVYYEVKRTIGGSDVYYTEKWALENRAQGGALNQMADSFVSAAAASNVLTGLDHLEGESVVAWGGGADLGTFVVSGGSITLHASTTYTNRCAGLPYTATYKGTKLAYSLPGGTGLTKTKKVDHIGLILADTHPNGLEFGPSFDTMDPLPEVEAYQDVAADTPWDEYEEMPIEFPGEWSTDSRVCLRATAPRPCTVLAVVVELETR